MVLFQKYAINLTNLAAKKLFKIIFFKDANTGFGLFRWTQSNDSYLYDTIDGNVLSEDLDEKTTVG